MIKHLLAGVAAVALLSACGGKEENKEANNEVSNVEVAAAAPVIGTWGFDTEGMDTSVAPGDDFYRYVGGTWMDNFEIPPELTRYGGFTTLSLEAEVDVRAIVDDVASKDSETGSLEQKVGDYYASWMDVEKLNELGAEPLAPFFAEIDAISSIADLQAAFASNHFNAPIGIGILPDPRDTTAYTASIGQAGIALPDRDYYFTEGETFDKYRAGYVDYLTKILTLADIDDAAAKASDIMALETRIAEVHWTQAENRDLQKLISYMTVDEIKELAPDFDWTAMFGQLGLGELDTFLVAQNSAIASAGEIMVETDLDTWKAYLKAHFIRQNAAFLAEDFDKANFEFFAQTLGGVEKQRDRWRRGVGLIGGSLGDAIGQIYVDRHFPASSKTQMEGLVDNLISAFAERLEANEWMDEKTRAAALVKLGTFEPRIGYSEKWVDYSNLSIEPGALLKNATAVNEFGWNRQVERLGKPVDRDEWNWPPQTVNASYNPLLNQITFPAGILQAPFFDPNADAAVNYGAIGAVIGHEIGHGFDDQGRLFDEVGRFQTWWTDDANKAFLERSSRLGAQYEQYSPVEGMNVNGQLTMGENIGDLGGLQMAYAAYHRYLDETSNGEAPIIDGLTGDQRFFLAWGQVWRSKIREDALRQQVLSDPHSPAEYRVNGVVRNMDAWYEAFNVDEDHALYLPPEERVRIW
ncbi:MAG: M13 family metallopeptidase [Pseudomonadota bacterium]